MQNELRGALDQAEARARHLQVDLSGLQLVPSDDDIASLQADGYLAEVLNELRATAGVTDTADAAVAQDALALLAGELSKRLSPLATPGRAAQ